MRAYLVTIGQADGTKNERIVARATRRAAAIKRALEHWQAGVGKRTSGRVLIVCDCVEARILADLDVDTDLDVYTKLSK